MSVMSLTIDAESVDAPLLRLVATALDNADTASWLIQRGGVWVGGRRVRDSAAVVAAGATVVIQRPPDGRYRDPIVIPARILYEDDDLIAFDKPPGDYVEATPWDAEGHLRAALARFLHSRDGVTPVLHLAHRLDRDTSGVLLLSKAPAVNGALQQAFEHGLAVKSYLAFCAGDPTFTETEIETGHGRGRGGLFRVFPREAIGSVRSPGGRVKAMHTRFAVIRRLGDAALVRAWPLTGRTHQIRLHLAYLGHPLVGDLKYGGPAEWHGMPAAHHHLHAWRLELPHPRSGALLTLEAPLPAWTQHAYGEANMREAI